MIWDWVLWAYLGIGVLLFLALGGFLIYIKVESGARLYWEDFAIAIGVGLAAGFLWPAAIVYFGYNLATKGKIL